MNRNNLVIKEYYKHNLHYLFAMHNKELSRLINFVLQEVLIRLLPILFTQMTVKQTGVNKVLPL